MILQALFNYYERMEDDLPPEGYEQKEIPFLIIINNDGGFVNLQDTRNKIGKKLTASKFRVPKENARLGKNAWQITNLLWDHYGYVLGYPKSVESYDKEMAMRQHKTFLNKIYSLADSFPEDIELYAVKCFYSNDNFKKVFSHPLWDDCKKISGCNLSFQINEKISLICQNENIKTYISKISEIETEDDDEVLEIKELEGLCMATGVESIISRLHPRTPILGAKSNAKIVSFQKNMGFDSYGKQQSYNAPMSKKAVFAYTTALNHLLTKDSHQKIYVGDTTTVFWAEKKHDFENVLADIFGEMPKDNLDQDYKEIIAMFKSPEIGARPEINPDTKFFVLGLAPNSARIAVRFWYAGSVREIANNIYQHFDDIEIVKSPNQPKYLSLFRLLASTALLGKSENIQPKLAGDFMKAILTGAPYPQTLLSSAMRRIRAEQSRKDKNGKAIPNVTYERASLIKAVLVRKARYYNYKKRRLACH